jgi:hypothetical protein
MGVGGRIQAGAAMNPLIALWLWWLMWQPQDERKDQA